MFRPISSPALVVLVFLAASTASFGQTSRPARSARGQRRAPSGLKPAQRPMRPGLARGLAQWLTRRLKLSDTQRQRVSKIAQELYKLYSDPDAKAMRMQEVQVALEEAEADQDSERVEKLRAELRRLRAGDLRAELLERVRPLLNEQQRAELEKIPDRSRQMPPIVRGGSDALAEIRRLRRTLKLDDKQKQTFDRLLDELNEQIRRPELSNDKLLELVERLQQASAAGDQERVTELRDELKQLRADARRSAIEHFYSELLPILTDEQRELVQRARSRSDARGRRRLDARRLLSLARRLDLRADQRRELKELERQTLDTLRGLRRDREARHKLAEDVERKIRALLDAEQTARFDELIARYRGDRPGKSGAKVRGRRGRRAKAAAGSPETPRKPQPEPREGGGDTP